LDDNKKLAVRVAIAALAGGGLAAYLFYGRSFAVNHALIGGAGIGALIYSSFRSYDNLRNIYKK